MIIDNISIKLVLDENYKTKPFFSLEQAQQISNEIKEESKIYQIIPNKTDIEYIIQEHNAYLVIKEYKGRFRAYDNDGSFILSKETIKNSLIELSE